VSVAKITHEPTATHSAIDLGEDVLAILTAFHSQDKSTRAARPEISAIDKHRASNISCGPQGNERMFGAKRDDVCVVINTP
jgi:hypothetical protein